MINQSDDRVRTSRKINKNEVYILSVRYTELPTKDKSLQRMINFKFSLQKHQIDIKIYKFNY